MKPQGGSGRHFVDILAPLATGTRKTEFDPILRDCNVEIVVVVGFSNGLGGVKAGHCWGQSMPTKTLHVGQQ